MLANAFYYLWRSLWNALCLVRDGYWLVLEIDALDWGPGYLGLDIRWGYKPSTLTLFQGLSPWEVESIFRTYTVQFPWEMFDSAPKTYGEDWPEKT